MNKNAPQTAATQIRRIRRHVNPHSNFKATTPRCPENTFPVVAKQLLCSFCKKPGADFQCCVCGTLYCGVECQLHDWQQHKYNNCIPMLVPRLATPVFIPPTFRSQPPSQTNFRPPDMNFDVSKPPPEVNVPTHSNKGNPNVVFDCHKQHVMDKQHNQLNKTSETRLQDCTLKNSKKLNTKPEAKPSIAPDIMKLAAGNPLHSKKACFLQQGPFPEQGSKVRISFVGDNEMFIYNAEGSPNQYLQFLKLSLQVAREVKQCLQVPPKLGDIVFAPFGGECYRAVVNSIEKENITAFMLDFGNSRKIKWKQCKEIRDPDIKYSKCLAHKVCINNIANFTRPMSDFLGTLVECEEFELTETIDTQTHIKMIELRHAQELYVLSTKLRALPAIAEQNNDKTKKPTVLNQKMSEGPTEILSSATDSYTSVLVEEFRKPVIPPGVVDFFIIEPSELCNGNNTIKVMLESDKIHCSKVVAECDHNGKNDPYPYNLDHYAQACLVKHKGAWMRAFSSRASETEETRYFHLLDFGIIRPADDISDVRRYPALLSRQLYVLDCIVDNPDALEVGGSIKRGTLLGKGFRAIVKHLENESDNLLHAKILDVHV